MSDRHKPRRDLDELVAALYSTLRKTAARALGPSPGRRSISPTDIVHDCYLKLARGQGLGTLSGAEFLALAATAIRTLLVDHARRRQTLKRGAGHGRITLSGTLIDQRASIDLTELDAALTVLAGLDPRMARIVELRFFAGMSVGEVARALGVSASTVAGDWTMAKAWLHRELEGAIGPSP